MQSIMRNSAQAVALSEEVTTKKPLGVDIGDQPIVLWRDKDGVAHALEDRCPHRRAPLSLGCVKADGNLQCGYHGWTFDGSGKVIEIPQVRGEKKLPSIYRAERFSATERDGFVFVALEGPPADHGSLRPTASLDQHGVAYSPIEYGRVVEILLDGPQLLLAFPGIRISEYPLADPEIVDGVIVYERGCRKAGGYWPDRLTAELPLSLKIALDPASGMCAALLRDGDHRLLSEAMISLVPSRRGTTAVRWRAHTHAGTGGMSLRRRPALAITGSPDDAALKALLKDASTVLDDIANIVPLSRSA